MLVFIFTKVQNECKSSLRDEKRTNIHFVDNEYTCSTFDSKNSATFIIKKKKLFKVSTFRRYVSSWVIYQQRHSFKLTIRKRTDY